MKKVISFISLTTILLASCLTSCASMQAPTDGAGNSGIRTVATTSVAICQILDLLEYDDVVAVPDTLGDLPARYKGLPTIGAPMTPDYEVIRSIAPDLVLSPKTLEASLAADYTAAGINSAFLDLASVEGMYSAITSLGKLLNREKQAKKVVKEYNDYMAAYPSPAADKKNVLLLMSFPDGFYLVATANSYVGNLVELAGGNNIYGKDAKGDENGFVNINPEDMLSRDPDIILVFAHYAEDKAFEFMKNEFANAASWQHYRAVQEGKIHYLPSARFGMSATLAWTEGLEHLKPILYE